MNNFNYNDGKPKDTMPPSFIEEKDLERKIKEYCIPIKNMEEDYDDNSRPSN